jgi:hypothetical protein
MLAYRNDEREGDADAAMRSLAARAREALTATSHDLVREVFIDFGQVESGIADRLFPQRDGLHPLTRTLRRGSHAAGHALLASWQHDVHRTRQALSSLLQCMDSIHAGQLPVTIPLRTPEGYAYYALHPETYAVAASRFAAERSPAVAVCLGIRSIGASLSGAVAAALEHAGVSVESYTVRPHGHPFDRRVDLADDLVGVLRDKAPHSQFLVIDEGPGLSGSSFASVVDALAGLGIDSHRIALFPSWPGNAAALRSENARRVWGTHRRYTADAEEAGFSVDQAIGSSSERVDLSAGAWRGHFLGDERLWPAVQPQHEAPKAWTPADRSIVRFAGIGRYGAAKRARAEDLAAAGLGADPLGLQHGYLSLRFVEGSPCTGATEPLLDRIAEHLAFLVRRFPASRSPSIADVEEMIQTNMRLALGDTTRLPDLSSFHGALEDAPCAAIDGRMLPHEWIQTETGYCKVDALDHHANHFFPGTQDAGWDLAAAAFEFRLDRAGVDHLVTRYASASGDRDIRRRLRFYDFAYPAFRLGYAALSCEALRGSADAVRFEQIVAACRARLRQVVAGAPD